MERVSYAISLLSAFFQNTFVDLHYSKGGEDKMISKKIIIPVLATVIVGGSLFSVSAVHAQAPTTTSPLSSLVDMISKTFNLDKTKVQSVVDQFHTEQQQKHQTEMQNRINARLDQAVKNGKITAAQKQSILTELATLKTKYGPDVLKNMSADQRKTALQNEKTELENFAKAQNIDISYFRIGFVEKGMFRVHGQKPTPTQK